MRGGSQLIDRLPPPGTTERDDHGGGGWAWLLTARGIIEAQLVRGLLETAGVVPIHLDAHDPSPGAWMFLGGDVNAPVRIYVLRSQLEAARLALLEGGLERPTAEPADGAPEEELVSRAGRWRSLWVVLALAVVAGFAWRLLFASCTVGAAC